MKIESIEVTNLRSHRSTLIKGLQRINVLLGPNAAGKTSVLNAVAYCMTGIYPGLSDTGAGSEHVARTGTKTFSVSLTTDKGKVTRSMGQGPRSAIHARIVGLLGLDPAAAKVLVQPLTFLRMEAKAQATLIQQYFGSSVSPEKVRVALGEDAVAIPEDRDLGTLEGIEEIEKELREARPGLKRELAQLVIPDAPAFDQAEYDALNRSLKRWEDLKTDEITRKSRSEGRAEALRSTLAQCVANKESIEAEIAASPVAHSIHKDLVAEIVKERDLALQEEKALADKVAVARGQYEAAKVDLTRAEAQLSAMRSVKGSCPTCQREAKGAAWTSLMEKAQEAVKAARERAGAKQEALRKVQQPDHSVRTAEVIQEELDGLHKAAAALEGLRARLKTLTASCEATKRDLEAAVAAPAPAEGEPADLDSIEAEIQAYKDTISGMDAARARLAEVAELRRKRQEVEATLEGYERLIERLGPKGDVRAMLLEGGLAALQKELSVMAEAVGLGDVQIAFEANGIRAGGVPAQLLSGSEEWRLAALFAVVFAKASGTGLALLDAGDILQGESKAFFNSLIDSAGLDQVFLAVTRDPLPDDVPDFDGWAFYAVQKDADGASIVTPFSDLVKA